MKNLIGCVNWQGIVGAISLFAIIALAVIVGHWIADYSNPIENRVHKLEQQCNKLEKQHDKILRYFE
jgi:hypothetical protein